MATTSPIMNITVFGASFNETENSTSSLLSPQSQSKLFRDVLRIASAITIGIVMMGMGCGADVEKLKHHLRRPTGIIVGAVCQFIFMPTIAFVLAKIFQMPDLHTLALLLVGSCPGGSSSNIVTYWIDGDMSLSLAMTTFSSILGFGTMPLLLWIYSFGFTGTLVVPFKTIGITLASLVGPIVIGILIRYKLPKVAAIILKITAVLGVICIITIVVLSFITYGGVLALTTSQIISAAVLSGTGMLLGYITSSIVSLYKPFYFHHYQRRTIALETGVQNNNLAGTIIQLSSFTLVEVGQIVLFPLVNFVGQVSWVILLMTAYKLYKLWKQSHSSSSDDEAAPGDKELNKENDEVSRKAKTNLGFVENEFVHDVTKSKIELKDNLDYNVRF